MNNLAKLLLVIFLSLPCSVFSQKYEKRGEQYLKVGNFSRAIKDFERALRRLPANKQLHRNLVLCYLKSNVDKAAALQYTSFLITNDTTAINLLNHSKAQFYNYQFENSLKGFERVKKLENEKSELYIEADLYIKWCLNAQAFVKSPVDVEFVNLGSGINTKENELNPFVTQNEDKLVYSNDKRYHSYAGVNYFNANISVRDKNKWTKGKSLGSAINSEYDEIVSGYHPDGEELFVFHNRKGTEVLASSKYKGNNRYDDIVEFEHLTEKKKGVFGVSLTTSGDTLLFAAENENGDTDIYYSIKLPNGEFGESRVFSENINTSGDENFPVLSYNNKRIYFSSTCENSMGGADLFYSDYNEEKKEWSKPVNMGYPINDLYDNYSISWVKNHRYAYVSAIRPEGYGQRDLYKLIFQKVKPQPIIIKGSVIEQNSEGTSLITSSMHVELMDTTNTDLLGMYSCSGDSSNFVLALDPGYYLLNFYKDGELTYSESLNISDMLYATIPEKMLFILPLKEDALEKDK